MKKKNIAMITALVLSLSLFTVTALAAGNSLEGYELLKEVMSSNQNMDVDSGQFTYTFSVSDNDEVVFATDGVATVDKEEAALISGTITDGDVEKAFRVSKVDDVVLFNDVENNLFYQVDESVLEDESESHRHQRYEDERFDDDHRPMTDTEERLLDALVGDMKNKVVLSNLSDGNRKISLDLEEDDIPMAVNLLLAVGAENETREMKHENTADFDALAKEFPFFEGFDPDCGAHDLLVEDIRVLGISLGVIVDASDSVIGFAFTGEMEGRDEEGQYHVLTMEMAVETIQLGQVTVEPLVVDGELIVIDEEKAEEYNRLFED